MGRRNEPRRAANILMNNTLEINIDKHRQIKSRIDKKKERRVQKS